jgi:hypothetical protein
MKEPKAPGTRKSPVASRTSIPAEPEPSPGKKFARGSPQDSLMASEVSFHEEGSAEFEIAFEWYYLRSDFVASRFAEEMNRAITMISDAPKRWPIAPHGTQKYILHCLSFIENSPRGFKFLQWRMRVEDPATGRRSFRAIHSSRSFLSSHFSILHVAHTIGIFPLRCGGPCAG